jgi:xanthine permease XanP
MQPHRFFPLDEKIPPLTAALCGAQHVLAMFVGIITPPLIIAGALGLQPVPTGFLVSMALFTSGLTTFIQVRRIGPFGSGMLSVQGTSFTFVPLAIQAGQAGGLPLIFGLTLAAAPVEIVLSRFIGLARRLFPPVVTGSVVMLIGVSLIKVGMTDLAGGYGSSDFGHLSNFGLGGFVMLVIILLNRFGKGLMWTISIAMGLVAGYLLAALLGRVHFGPLGDAAWVTFPTPLAYGLTVRVDYLIPWMIAYVVSMIETMGDLSATSMVSREPVSGPVFVRRLQGGVLADGAGSMLAALFNATPNTTFSQNNGVIALTGVAARRAGLAVAFLLVALGLFPKFGALISVMPKPVLGGATIIMFAMVAVAGLGIVERDGLTPRNQFILALSLALGLGVTLVPEALEPLGRLSSGHPVGGMLLTSLQIILSSGLAVTAITATALNLLFPPPPP